MVPFWFAETCGGAGGAGRLLRILSRARGRQQRGDGEKCDRRGECSYLIVAALRT